MSKAEYMTHGEAYFYKNRYEELLAENLRLEELYGEQQVIVEAYAKYISGLAIVNVDKPSV